VVAKAGIHNDIKADTIVSGIPAIEVHAFRRYAVALPRIPEMLQRLRAIERALGLSRRDSDKADG
jgi:UDP-3-O-[3-hydroxymyristoyl] glucosamine N-acyltransferase